MYDLAISNVDLSANTSNHKVMFPEYWKNIPQISVSKIFRGYPRNIVRLLKNVGYLVKVLILAGSLLY